MARLLKLLLILIAAVVGVGVLASIALFLFFDPNDFRDDIAAGVKATTGRDLVIEGDIELSVFPWIAVEIGRTRLGNAEGFGDEPFLGFENARLSVRLLPLLLRQEVAVGTASLDSLAVNLQVNKSGKTNWDDLAEGGVPDDESADEDEPGDAGAIDIASILVSNASVSYVDAQAGSTSSISGLTVETGQIAVGTPFDIDAEFTFESSPGDLAGVLSMSGTFLLGEALTNIDIAGLNISGTLDGIAADTTDFNFDARAIMIDTSAENVTLGEMDLGILGLSMAANVEPFSYAGNPEPKATLAVHEFSLKDLMATLGEVPPETSDPNALQRVSFSANAIVGPGSIALSDMQLTLDDTNMTGTLSVPTVPDGKLLFDLGLDSMVLDHYMAPPTEGMASSESDEEANVEIPVDMIRALNASGKFQMDQATLSGIVFENLELGVNSANGELRLHPITAEMFDGAYNGDISVDASGSEPVISVNENIVDVQLTSLAKAMYGVDNISGSINGSFVLSGSGADMDAIRQDLDGNVSFVLADGEWQGTDVWHELRKARAKLKQEEAPEPRLPPRTEFSSVSASGTVTDGVLQNRDFLAELPFLRMTGAGKVDFVQANVDYSMEARVVESPEFAGDVSAEELNDFTSLVIPLKVYGPLSAPTIVPDVEAIIRREVEKEVEKQKDALIDKLLGGDDKPAEGEEEKEPDVEDQIKDALKKLLKD